MKKVRIIVPGVTAALTLFFAYLQMFLLSHIFAFFFGSMFTIVIIKERTNVIIWLNARGVNYGIGHKEKNRNKKLGKTTRT